MVMPEHCEVCGLKFEIDKKIQAMIDDINQKAMKKQEKIDTKIQKRRNKIDKTGIAEEQIWQY